MNSGLTELTRIEINNKAKLIIVAGSILDYVGDAIVNAANEGGTGGFGVDEVINRAGGFKLKEARKLFNGIPTGEAKVTESFEHTKVSHIIHAVGPVYRLKLGMKEEDDHSEFFKSKDPLLISAYRASLQRAKELGVKTLGFTLLSAGVFKGARSLKDILEIGIHTIIDNCYEGLTEVTMVAFTKEEQDELVNIVKHLHRV